jgi:rare lipoprotein A
LKPALFDRLVDGTGAALAASSSLTQQLEDDAMKWTLMVTPCLIAFAFSPPASALHSAKAPHAGLFAGHASASKHMASDRGRARRHQVAVIHPRHEAHKHAGDERVASPRHHQASFTSRHGRFAAVRNRSVREAGAGSEVGSVGMASYYSASGLTAAHRSLPFGTRVRVTNLSNGSSVVVRINDRGPFIRSRSIDLSTSAARAIGMTGAGVARVRMHVI